MLRRSFLSLRRGCGLVGLPNCGKSTTFNAISQSSHAKTGNYDFCTIDANLTKVGVYDPRLEECAKFANSKRIVPAEIDLADVAGLIKGAHKGAGLGNKFLADIRPCTVMLHMVRCFENAREGFDAPDPSEAISIIDSELMLADLQSVEKRVMKNKSKGTVKGSDGFDEGAFAKEVLKWLEDGKPARDLPSVQPRPASSSPSQQKEAALARRREALGAMQLLSAKPTIFVLNVDEDSMKDGNEFSRKVEDIVGAERCVRVCALIEEQTAQMSRSERLEFLKDGYGIARPAVEDLMQRVFDLLKLQSFFTVGPLMAKAWPIRTGTTARAAAGEIHGDFEKYFEEARVMPHSKFIQHPNVKVAESKMYPVPASFELEDGMVMIVEHSAKR